MRAQQTGSRTLSHEIRRFAPQGGVPRLGFAYQTEPSSPEDQLLRLGKAIRAVRKASGLSQEDLAYEAEIDYSTMGEIERGQRNATLVKVMRIATALNKSMADLFAGAEI
jgi:DNA-binding XRE family transcriptional regulator